MNGAGLQFEEELPERKRRGVHAKEGAGFWDPEYELEASLKRLRVAAQLLSQIDQQDLREELEERF